MKFELTASFLADCKRLNREELEVVRARLPDFVAACDRYAADPSTKWPESLRVKDAENAPGILEMTFKFTGPDIWATFEWTQVDGELAVQWRRIGGHRVFEALTGFQRSRSASARGQCVHRDIGTNLADVTDKSASLADGTGHVVHTSANRLPSGYDSTSG